MTRNERERVMHVVDDMHHTHPELDDATLARACALTQFARDERTQILTFLAYEACARAHVRRRRAQRVE